MALATAKRRKVLWESSEHPQGNRHIRAGSSHPAHAQNGLAEVQTTDAMTAMTDLFALVLMYWCKVDDC